MLIRLKEPLDFYHQRRAAAHGWLYILEKKRSVPQARRGTDGVPKMRRDLLEARSIATGVVCTFAPEYVETAHVEEPELP